MERESNKLLAEFIGLLESSIPNQYWTKKSSEGFGRGQLTELKFHTDWNWLVQIVEKIESNNFSIEMNKQEEGDYQCLITKGNNIMFQKFSNIKIEAVYNACVEFIKYYNGKNSKVTITTERKLDC
jgi:hypothetical protein